MYNYNLKCEGIYEVGDLLGKPGIYGRVDLVTNQAVKNEKAKVIEYVNEDEKTERPYWNYQQIAFLLKKYFLLSEE